MILKDKVISQTTSVTAKAGQRQEQDVAFFLRRHFKEHKDVYVFNDLKFKHNDETAQIDHLILYPFGFILIESKSITGEVSVNKEEEWSRSYNGQWRGMASPIKQVELQQKLFRDLLFERRTEILDTFLLMQQSFGGRCWHNICAVSSNAIIERDSMPKVVSSQLVKSEFVADKIKNIMKLHNPLLKVLSFIDSRPAFNKQELQSIADFLLANDYSTKNNAIGEEHQSTLLTTPTQQPAEPWKAPTQLLAPNKAMKNDAPLVSDNKPSILTITCSRCNDSSALTPKPGRYGYYVKCQSCEGNTPMKQPCPHCQSKKTKVSKKKETYTLNCESCAEGTPIEA